MKLTTFLASVNLFIDQSQKKNVLSELSKLKNTKEVYETAGEYDVVSLISASSVEEFRDILQKQVMKIEGVESVITTVILNRHKEATSENKQKSSEGNQL